MATTQIAQELDRIIGAKQIIGVKAAQMGLNYDNEHGGKTAISDGQEPIEAIANAIEDIAVWKSPGLDDPEDVNSPGKNNTEGITVFGNEVRVKDGYYSGNREMQVVRVQSGSTGTPTVSIDPANGKITVTKTQTEGYIHGGTQDYDAGTVQHEHLTEGNIKYGTTVFGIEGKFTEDANASSDKIVKNSSAYVKGQKVEGSIPDYGDMGLRRFNPLETDQWDMDENGTTGALVKSLRVGFSDDLLNLLKTI